MSPHDPIDPRRGHSLWIDDDVVGLDPVARLADRSNLPRRDPRVTNTGGGHTISKIEERGVATDDLRSPLATFYAQRTLTGAPIAPADQADAALLLASRRLSKSTGQTLTVGGGLTDAFFRRVQPRSTPS